MQADEVAEMSVPRPASLSSRVIAPARTSMQMLSHIPTDAFCAPGGSWRDVRLEVRTEPSGRGRAADRGGTPPALPLPASLCLRHSGPGHSPSPQDAGGFEGRYTSGRTGAVPPLAQEFSLGVRNRDLLLKVRGLNRSAIYNTNVEDIASPFRHRRVPSLTTLNRQGGGETRTALRAVSAVARTLR